MQKKGLKVTNVCVNNVGKKLSVILNSHTKKYSATMRHIKMSQTK